MSPAVALLLSQVLIGAGVLFAIAYIGNRITFSNRFLNALVTALIFAVFYGALSFTVDTTVLPPEVRAARHYALLDMIIKSSAVVFVTDLVANMLSFSNRLVSAFVTAALFAVLFAFLILSTGSAASFGGG